MLGIVLQLTVLNGLRLPGGGVPDLVLILVAALAMTEGPLSGLVIGFAAGLCLDLAPPGSQLIGQYALIFCLAGWAAGRLSGPAGRSALRSVLLVGVVVAAAEVLTAAAGLVLEPAQVTLAEIREVLPATIGYDLVLCPFVLYLVVVLSMLVTDGLAGGSLGGLLAAPTRSQRLADSRSQRLRKPRFAHSSAGGPHGAPGTRQQNPARRDKRLRPANGIAGSASGLARHPRRPAAPPVSLRLGAGRRRDGAIASAVGAGQRGYRQPGRHPGALAGAHREFRPRAGEPGGSATRPHRVAPPGRSAPAIRFGTARRGGTAGRRQGSAWLTRPSRAGTGPRLRMGASRSAVTGGHPGSAVPRLQFSRPPRPSPGGRLPPPGSAAGPCSIRGRHRPAWSPGARSTPAHCTRPAGFAAHRACGCPGAAAERECSAAPVAAHCGDLPSGSASGRGSAMAGGRCCRS